MSTRKKEQSFSTRCTKPARCPVVCELSVVARSPSGEPPHPVCRFPGQQTDPHTHSHPHGVVVNACYMLRELALTMHVEPTCPICHEDMPEEGRVTTPCKHALHTHCLNSWRSRSDSCPLCRQNTTPLATWCRRCICPLRYVPFTQHTHTYPARVITHSHVPSSRDNTLTRTQFA